MSCPPLRTVVRCQIPEGATSYLTATIRDQAGAVLPADELDTVVGTLYDEKSGEILNGRDHVDLLNANGAVINSEGEIIFRLDPDDNAIVNDARDSEQHILLLEWTYTVALVEHRGEAEVAFTVKNFAKVPEAT